LSRFLLGKGQSSLAILDNGSPFLSFDLLGPWAIYYNLEVLLVGSLSFYLQSVKVNWFMFGLSWILLVGVESLFAFIPASLTQDSLVNNLRKNSQVVSRFP